MGVACFRVLQLSEGLRRLPVCEIRARSAKAKYMWVSILMVPETIVIGLALTLVERSAAGGPSSKEMDVATLQGIYDAALAEVDDGFFNTPVPECSVVLFDNCVHDSLAGFYMLTYTELNIPKLNTYGYFALSRGVQCRRYQSTGVQWPLYFATEPCPVHWRCIPAVGCGDGKLSAMECFAQGWRPAAA